MCGKARPCGPSNWKCEEIPWLFRLHVPQFVFRGACTWHDEQYTLGGTEAQREYADETFYSLMKASIGMRPWWQRPYFRLFAGIFYQAVKHYGRAHFNYHA